MKKTPMMFESELMKEEKIPQSAKYIKNFVRSYIDDDLSKIITKLFCIGNGRNEIIDISIDNVVDGWFSDLDLLVLLIANHAKVSRKQLSAAVDKMTPIRNVRYDRATGVITITDESSVYYDFSFTKKYAISVIARNINKRAITNTDFYNIYYSIIMHMTPLTYTISKSFRPKQRKAADAETIAGNETSIWNAFYDGMAGKPHVIDFYISDGCVNPLFIMMANIFEVPVDKYLLKTASWTDNDGSSSPLFAHMLMHCEYAVLVGKSVIRCEVVTSNTPYYKIVENEPGVDTETCTHYIKDRSAVMKAIKCPQYPSESYYELITSLMHLAIRK